MLGITLNLHLINRDHISREITPSEEPCTQAGDCLSQMYLEGNTLKDQLERQFGPPPEDFNFCLSCSNHEAGAYLSLELQFSTGYDTSSLEYAMKVDRGWPEFWDQTSRETLAAQQYHLIDSLSNTPETTHA